MPRIFILVLSLVTLLGFTACNSSKNATVAAEPSTNTPAPTPNSGTSYVKTLTTDNFGDLIKNGKGVRVAYFTAVWCGPCRQIAPTIETIGADYKDKIVLGKLDVDDHRDVAVSHGVKSIPTIIFYKDGEIVHRSTGVVTEQYLRTVIDELL